ncbi:MAG: hypothetical protein WD960_08720 [Gemmatimonadota bacterium]
MSHDDPLMMGMFWGGLLVSSVPILLTIGIAVYVVRKMREDRRKDEPQQPPLGG